MRSLFLCCGLLALAACDHTDADLAHSQKVCQSMGIVEGSPQFPACVQQQFANRQQWRANVAGALSQAGQSIQNSQPTTATCTTVGNTVSCTQY